MEGEIKKEYKDMEESVNEWKKILDQFEDLMRKYQGVIPRERNFDIELQKFEQEVTVGLKHREKDKKKNLAVFLPPGYFFKEGERFFCNRLERGICFAKNEVQFRGFLLYLFHEIGHAHDKRKPPITIFENIIAFLQVAFEMPKRIPFKRVVKQGRGNRKNIILEIMFLQLRRKPQWYREKLARFKARKERDAWALALKLLKKLKQEGYDVFAGYENVKQIRTDIAYSLTTYEIDLYIDRVGEILLGNLNDLKVLEKLESQPLLFQSSYKKTKR